VASPRSRETTFAQCRRAVGLIPRIANQSPFGVVVGVGLQFGTEVGVRALVLLPTGPDRHLTSAAVAQKKRGWFGFRFPRGAADSSRAAITSITSKITPISFPYRRKSRLSPAELAFYDVLKAAVGDRFLILIKLGVRDLCEITHREVNQAAFNRVAAKQVDFVLCDQVTLAPLVAIELDDSTHYPRERAERDAFVNELFRVIGVALIHQRVQGSYDAVAVARWVDAAVAGLGRPTPSSPNQIRPAS
jgi:uncharacterized protein DUF2726